MLSLLFSHSIGLLFICKCCVLPRFYSVQVEKAAGNLTHNPQAAFALAQQAQAALAYPAAATAPRLQPRPPARPG